MNGSELLRIVDTIHRDKSIDKEIVFEGIEQAIVNAARKHFGEESEVVVSIDRESGRPEVRVDEDDLNADEIGDLLGRVAAQTAKQVMIQKIREAERDTLFDEYSALKSQLVSGSVTRADGGSANVSLGKVEAILPRSEQIPNDSYRTGDRVRAIVLDVRKAGTRVRIILSRNHPDLVRRLFEIEIPEIADHAIEVRSIARKPGERSKVAVSCYDPNIDAVGACVGVRGARIKNIVNELAGERIDIVRWNDSLQVLVPNALQPAEVEDVILCPMLGKVIVLVQDDQLPLAIGKHGQNVRLASKLVGWDIHVMTEERLQEQLDESIEAFSHVPNMTDDLSQTLVEQGFFTFDDLSVIEPDQLAELGELTPEQRDAIIAYADTESMRLEEVEEQERRARREAARLERTLASAGVSSDTQSESEATAGDSQEDESATSGDESAEDESGIVDSGDTAGEENEAAEPDSESESETTAEDESNIESVQQSSADDVSEVPQVQSVGNEATGEDTSGEPAESDSLNRAQASTIEET